LPPKRSSKPGKARKSPIDLRLVKALTHDLRVQILEILNERIASPKELAAELGEGLPQVSYHVNVLREYDCIELVSTAPRRGATEHYYRANSRGLTALALLDFKVPKQRKTTPKKSKKQAKSKGKRKK
jgi:DNA-binding transcriptional ArsR family regulator